MWNKYFACTPFACALLVSPLGATAIVSGVFKNANPGERIEIFVPHDYLDGHNDSYRADLDAQGQFSLAVELPEAQLVFLLRGEDRLPVFLEPTDTLQVRTDAFQFPLVVTFGGPAAANNRLLAAYLRENPADFNEFNNLRFKIGLWWASIEAPANNLMESLPPQSYKEAMDKRRTAAEALFNEFANANPGALSPLFQEWLSTEIVYQWAYHLLFYGQVYKNRYLIGPEFFTFLYDAPLTSEVLGNSAYRQFLLTLMARQQARADNKTDFYAAQYRQAGELLSGKALAFFRSEIIRMAFSAERYSEILPYYTQFLQTNTYESYDLKITPLYEKSVRVSPGVAAPAFSGKDAGGLDVSLAQYRGKVVYLNFWASWCAACLKKMELFNDYTADLNRQGVEIINVSIDEDADNWRNALNERQFKGANLLASAGQGRNIARIYGVEAVPQYFIIGKNGAFVDKPLSSQPEDIKRRLLEQASNR